MKGGPIPRDGRYEWLMAYIEKHGQVDILNSDLVDGYIAATKAKHVKTCWGAYHCPMLGRDLAHMARSGALESRRLGLSGGSWQPGFPKWVWTYRAGLGAYLYQSKKETANEQQT